VIDSNHADWSFADFAREAFSFLCDIGFVEMECCQTLVRWKKGDVGVRVYQGRQSYELGTEITFLGKTYSLNDLVRAIEPESQQTKCMVTAMSKESVATATRDMGALLRRYGAEALEGNAKFFSRLEEDRAGWVDSYWLEARARLVRPQAEEAFRNRDYAKAVELYGQIHDCLSKAELKKLQIARERLKS